VATPPGFNTTEVWADPVSLAATQGLTFVFSSSGYLDVSVHPVPSTGPMCSDLGTSALPLVGFPIRTSSDQRLFGAYPRLFAACHVLRRLLAPRHPPYALISLVLMLALAMEFPRCRRTHVTDLLRGEKNRRLCGPAGRHDDGMLQSPMR
jgi:hypothetical protein